MCLQAGFFDFVVVPLLRTFIAICPQSQEALELVESNRARWVKLHEGSQPSRRGSIAMSDADAFREATSCITREASCLSKEAASMSREGSLREPITREGSVQFASSSLKQPALQPAVKNAHADATVRFVTPEKASPNGKGRPSEGPSEDGLSRQPVG